ncbi:MAG: 4Fe-4S dicluster domain-containing protein [Elusimicrobia bacterium]|nr:4Fe-4S dicluster domain-containing protein [Elusimicrobiota bacterium]
MKSLSADRLQDLAAALSAAGYRVVAPVEADGVVRFAPWSPGAAIRTDAVPVNSLKDVFFPPSEAIGRWRRSGDGFDAIETRPEAPKTAALAARPCDVAALAMLDAVFNWDFRDSFYDARRAATVVAALACSEADEECFCTSVGGRPDAAPGADALLRPADGGRTLIVEPLTDQGRDLAAAASGVLQDGAAAPDAPPEVRRRFDIGRVGAWLAGNFDSPLWKELSLPCLGCAACAYACPACHCFDIQDESGPNGVVRLRNWDACGLGLFTLHASGHNPRPDQASRWRQRVMHKLAYAPERFKVAACTGCGRCGRVCPRGMSLADTAERIAAAAAPAAGPAAGVPA